MDEIRDKYNSGEAQAREAFEELCAMCDAFHVIFTFILCTFIAIFELFRRASIGKISILLITFQNF